MDQDNLEQKAVEVDSRAAARPNWTEPRFEVLPISMSRNSKPLKPLDITGGPGFS